MGTADTGTEQIGVEFLIVGGDEDGQRITDYFPLSEKAIQFTFEKLLAAGWDGQDMVEWTGLGSVDCRLVVEDEEYQGKWKKKIVFVNRAGVGMKNAMNAGQKSDFAARMRGHLAAFQQEKGIVRGGATRPAATAGKAYQGGARGGFAGNNATRGKPGAGDFDTPPDDDAPPYA